MNIKEILIATKGVLLSGDENLVINNFSQDSRQIQEDDMYIALIGENLDGHQFIESAIKNGAKAILSSQKISVEGIAIIYVEDTLLGLQNMARYVRRNRDIKVIGITGSVGKTSTKDIVHSVVSRKYKTLKTLGNYNNEIGLPLTILRHQDEAVLVLEMGMNHLREMALLSSICQPDIAIITNVGTAHIGELGSRENILKAKMEIIEYMLPNQTLIINGDNDMLQKVRCDSLKMISVGIENECTYHARNIHLQPTSSSFEIMIQHQNYKINVPVSGRHFITNAMLAIAVGQILNISMEDIITGIEKFELTKNRMDIIYLKNGLVVIDGTYNASEDSMKSSLDVLETNTGRKIAILADMLEMGEFSKELHYDVGQYVASKNIDQLYCVGQDAKYIYDGAIDGGMQSVFYYPTNASLTAIIDTKIQANDTLLIKGSNGMKLNEVVTFFKEKYND